MDGGGDSVVGGVAGFTPDSVGFGADDALCAGDAEGELASGPVAGHDDEVHAQLSIGAEDVVGVGSNGSLDGGDVGGGVSSTDGVSDDADAVVDVFEVSSACCYDAAVGLAAAGSPGGVAFDGVDGGALYAAGGDADVVGYSVSVPIKGYEVAGLDVPFVEEDASSAGLGFAAGDVGADPVDVALVEDPGDEHVAVWDSAGSEGGAVGDGGVPAPVFGAGLEVFPSGVAYFCFGGGDDLLCGGHVAGVPRSVCLAATPKNAARRKLNA